MLGGVDGLFWGGVGGRWGVRDGVDSGEKDRRGIVVKGGREGGFDMTATNLWIGMWMCRRNGTALCGG